ncbi:MAG: aminotransferase class I/II-fold pyridoxal phosphate-dependent enzyme [Vampirovibrionales bacterium]|nr:aminotransferase class I/II-fold pyridoxal phosphate-dependent enzyme [Vampirovibrionales bacterium]
MLAPFTLEDYFLAHEAKAKIYMAASGVPPWPLQRLLALASPAQQDAFNALSLGYSVVPGLPETRSAVTSHLNGPHRTLTPQNITVTSGTSEAIYCAAHALMRRFEAQGQSHPHAIALTPCYQSLYSVFESLGARVNRIELQASNAWRPDLDEITASLTPETRVIIANTPNSPTGQMFSRSQFEALIALARKHDLWLLFDEVYRGLEHEPNHRLPALASVYERGISVGGLSKAFGMPGLRIGWVAAQSLDILALATQAKPYLSLTSSPVSEFLAQLALSHTETIWQQNVETILTRKPSLESFLQENQPELNCQLPISGCSAWVKIASDCDVKPLLDDEQDLSSWGLALLHQTGVFVVPGSVYGLPYAQYFRLGFAQPDAQAGFSEISRFLRLKKD